MRSPAEMQIIQLEITNACPKKCGACTRMAPHVREPFFMTPLQFEQAVQSMEGFPGLLGVMGGEPTVHPQFEHIARLFAEIWGREGLADNGRGPIADFSAYANERLHDTSSRRGLWSSLGPAYYRHYETIQEVFDYQCINTHENPGLHQAVLITRKEMGIPDEEWVRLRDACWVQNTWSASVNVHGAYFCEVAAALDALYFKGKHAWKVEPGWWKRKPPEFGDQLNLCELCACALPGPSVVGNEDRDIVSPIHLAMLQDVKSPAVKKGAFDVFDPAKETDKLDERVDRYMPSPEMRVSPDHSSVRPHRLACVVVCVGYHDKLSHTLPRNLGQVHEMIVVTTPDDNLTQAVVKLYPDVKLVLSSRCYEGGDAFNKGKMLNDGLKAIDNPDWVVLTDADVFLPNGLNAFMKGHAINPGCLYGVERYDLEAHEEAGFLEHGRHPTRQTHGHLSREPNGYFQLFNRRALAIRDRWPNVMAETFCSAGGVDSWFMQQFPVAKRVMLEGMPAVHIAHGEDLGANWNGQWADFYPTWQQAGMITGQGMFLLPGKTLPDRCRLRLTDTVNGKSVEIESNGEEELPLDVLRVGARGDLIFLGESIGSAHVHLAYKTEA